MPVVGKLTEAKKKFKRWDDTPRPKRDKRKAPKVEFACDECGKVFVLTETAAEGRSYCSATCADIAKQVPLEQRLVGLYTPNPETGCWEWHGRVNAGGYGTIRDGAKMVLAHRVSFNVFNGGLSLEDKVCHRCNNRKCVNPVHLYAGTHEDNMLDLSLANTSSFSKTEWEDRRRMYDLVEEGVPLEEIAATFDVTEKTVRGWHARFKAGDRIPPEYEVTHG